jgi:hypothetical protein
MAKSKDKTDLGLDADMLDGTGETDLAAEPVAEVGVAAIGKDADGVPYCRTHHVRMRQYSGKTKDNPKAYYRCPVPDCDATASLVRIGAKSVPSEPLTCPECRRLGKTVYMVRDDRRSNHSAIVLACTACGYSVGPLALPHTGALLDYQRRRGTKSAGQIGDR